MTSLGQMVEMINICGVCERECCRNTEIFYYLRFSKNLESAINNTESTELMREGLRAELLNIFLIDKPSSFENKERKEIIFHIVLPVH